MCITPLCCKGLISVYNNILSDCRVISKICAMPILVTTCIPIKQHFLALDSFTSCLNKHGGPLLGLTDISAKLTKIARLNSLFCLSSVQMEL